MSHCPSCTKHEPCTMKNPCCDCVVRAIDCVVRAIREEDESDETLYAKVERYEIALRIIADGSPAPSITAQYALNPNPR